jgi:predicted ATPase
MQYIYLHNCRGFSNAIIPLRKCSFLVGENSTGKSSFLHFLRLVNSGDFWLFPRFHIEGDESLGDYSDIVSAWASDKSKFAVGVLHTRSTRTGSIKIDFAIHQFGDKDAFPLLISHVHSKDGKTIYLRLNPKNTEYELVKTRNEFSNEEEAVKYFSTLAAKLGEPSDNLKSFPKSIPPNPPPAFAVHIIQTLEAGGTFNPTDLRAEIPIPRIQFSWIAPIRSRPQRIYSGIQREYSSEGEHSPFVLRKQLKSRSFVEKLRTFGEASGLFETVITHTFARGQRNPFEVMIRLLDTDLNIRNVGYGISQVLPLVIEILSADRHATTFAIQQPEVHLHPKAQAALGSLLFEASMVKGHSFVIETHSDFLIDRFRIEQAGCDNSVEAQVLFFSRKQGIGNTATPLEISASGGYPNDQPEEFREFFLSEELSLFSL